MADEGDTGVDANERNTELVLAESLLRSSLDPLDIRRGGHASEHCQKHLGALVTAKADEHPKLSFEQTSDETHLITRFQPRGSRRDHDAVPFAGPDAIDHRVRDARRLFATHEQLADALAPMGAGPLQSDPHESVIRE
jgi:hypothetical protein